ncbi:hypothetical protein PoB_005326800 [Plakobranchus ocellatus]|uniref:Uncharacterized protein n=1 Tax=Plakobranchus ocellatus TaxID=259542 RepID=A0AAV4C5N8_9GAST|nr:hypothetical protein PoB_005326800 [Plakobranchus ocellatus]
MPTVCFLSTVAKVEPPPRWIVLRAPLTTRLDSPIPMPALTAPVDNTRTSQGQVRVSHVQLVSGAVKARTILRLVLVVSTLSVGLTSARIVQWATNVWIQHQDPWRAQMATTRLMLVSAMRDDGACGTQ